MSSTRDTTPCYASAAEVEALVRGWETCALPRERWTHAAHLTVALWHLLHYDYEEAVGRVRSGIMRYNEAHGVVTTRTGGYHETLTVFWMRHVAHFLAAGYNEARSLVRLANELAASADRAAPLEHYSRELLFSWEARTGWVEPDLKPLPAPELSCLAGA
jgi:hypothetical protein